MIEENSFDETTIDEKLRLLDKEILNYISKKLINEYFAFYLAKAYQLNVIWKSSNIEYELKDAVDYIRNCDLSTIDLEKVKSILKEKYSLQLTNNYPIHITSNPEQQVNYF